MEYVLNCSCVTYIVLKLIGLAIVIGALSGAVFDFQSTNFLKLRHDMFLIYGGYGIFMFIFALIGIASVYWGESKSLLVMVTHFGVFITHKFSLFCGSRFLYPVVC